MQKKSSSSVKVFYPRFSREEVLQRLYERAAALGARLSLKRVVLFGSYARGRHTVASDIDVLVVYHGETKEDAYALVKRTLDIPRLEPHVYSEAEYEGVRGTFERMVQDGVVIYVSSEGAG